MATVYLARDLKHDRDVAIRGDEQQPEHGARGNRYESHHLITLHQRKRVGSPLTPTDSSDDVACGGNETGGY